MLQLNVALPSGRSETFSLPQSSKVGDLRVLAQKSFQCGFLRLVTANNHTVDPTESLQAAGLREGDHLTAIATPLKVAATRDAIALWCCGGNQVVTRGRSRLLVVTALESKISSRVSSRSTQLVGAFAAILADGSVVTWGNLDFGGDSFGVKDQLKGVQQVHATSFAFAAILADGSVVTWGNRISGCYSSGVKDQLKGVQQVHATSRAFAAILADGSVVTWGDPDSGGDSSGVKDQLKGVQQVEGTERGYVAILADTSVVTWGDPRFW